MKEGKDVDYHVRQGIPEVTMLNSNNIIGLNLGIHVLCLFIYVNTILEFNFLIDLYTSI